MKGETSAHPTLPGDRFESAQSILAGRLWPRLQRIALAACACAGLGGGQVYAQFIYQPLTDQELARA